MLSRKTLFNSFVFSGLEGKEGVGEKSNFNTEEDHDKEVEKFHHINVHHN